MKSDNKIKIIIISLGMFLIISIGFSFYFINSEIINFKNNNESSISKIELKRTEVNSPIKEGIYITDVSEVVENVMPSIVAITSKTLIQSGRFGPNYYGYGKEQYTEGQDQELLLVGQMMKY